MCQSHKGGVSSNKSATSFVAPLRALKVVPWVAYVSKTWHTFPFPCSYVCILLIDAFMSNAYECPLLPSFSFVGILNFGNLKGPTGNKPFTLTHSWTIICDCPKFKEQYAAQKKNEGPTIMVEHEEGKKRPRGKTNSKVDEKHDAATFTLQEIL